MIISYQWLLSYLPKRIEIEELSDILTSIGLEVEGIEKQADASGNLDGLIVGEVLTCEKHPDADKLKITTVNIGADEPLNIVCGAPNVAAGQKVVVATIGTLLHPTSGESFKIKKSKIRGAVSEGMLCAEDEMGIGESHDGIMVLPPETAVGKALKEVLNIEEADVAIHIGLTPNRSDAMSHIGVARDVCAYLTHHSGQKTEVVMPEIQSPIATAKNEITVKIEEPKACHRYAGISLSHLKVEASPEWMQKRLKMVGVRPINNVVDITNFVLHEFGQPLHAFDADKIKGAQINVRFLNASSSFITLDDQQRTLSRDDLMICDAENGMCIAGVFGGKGSGVSETTTRIFLESAHFDRHFIRRTSLRHGLRTDAATRFEKGADIENVIPALKRAVSLLIQYCGAQVDSGITDIFPNPKKTVEIETSLEYISQLSGKKYSTDAVSSILSALGFEVKNPTPETFKLLVPSGKTDMLQPADVVEEILRIDGLDNIPIPEKLNISLLPQKEDGTKESEKLTQLLTGAGFQEIVTNSITNSQYFPVEENLVRMKNSLTSELDVMRPAMLESGLEVLQYNLNRKNENLFLFEWGKVYKTIETGYREDFQLALWMTGNIQEADWQKPAQKTDSFFGKGIIQNMLQKSGIGKGVSEKLDENGRTIWSRKGKKLATLFEVNETTTKKFDIRQPVFHALIFWETWLDASRHFNIQFSEVPKHPAVNRDLSIVLENSVSYGQVKDETEQLKLSGLQSFRLFDVFENEKLGTGKKAYALNYKFQSKDRTLTDAEVDKMMQQLMTAYRNKLGALIRE